MVPSSRTAAAGAGLCRASPRSTTTLLACNIYVSSGGARPRHTALLLKLLEDAQRWCLRSLGILDDNNGESDCVTMPAVHLAASHSTPIPNHHNKNHSSSPPSSSAAVPASSVRVVHAFADRVYDRSSFHLAGAAPAVVKVASHLALEAMTAFRQSTSSSDDDNIPPQQRVSDPLAACHPHPSVGLVDHIAVMPLTLLDGDGNHVGGSDQSSSSFSSADVDSCGWAAQQIGQALERHHHHPHLRVLYYGLAHPDGHSLAQVRREQTAFFHRPSQALTVEMDAPSSLLRSLGTVTVGAPSTGFGENVNLRLRSLDSAGGRTVARSLARWVRARDGGLPHVEALSLPYSHGRWEVACNLLQPSETSMMDVIAQAREWDAAPKNGNGRDLPFLEKCYRVGTTEQMCFEALALDSAEQVEAYDLSVRDRFLHCLINDP